MKLDQNIAGFEFRGEPHSPKGGLRGEGGNWHFLCRSRVGLSPQLCAPMSQPEEPKEPTVGVKEPSSQSSALNLELLGILSC